VITRAALIVTCLIASVPAAAQDAGALMDEGLALRREGRDAEAAERFRAAYAIERSGRALAQLALAEQAAGEWVAAERDLVAAMALSDPWIVEHRGVLESALATIRSHLGRLQVVANVARAAVWIDGREAATLPMAAPISAVAGTVVVEVRADGYVPVQRSATIRAGELSRLSVELVPSRVTSAAPIAIAPATRSAEGATSPGRSSQADASPLLIGGLVTAGVAAVSLAGMIAALVIREGNVQHWNDDARCPPDLPGGRLQTCAAVWSSLRTAEDWAIASGIATGAFTALASVLIGLGATEEIDDTSARLHVGPDVVVIDVRARF